MKEERFIFLPTLSAGTGTNADAGRGANSRVWGAAGLPIDRRCPCTYTEPSQDNTNGGWWWPNRTN